jgi:lactoylglutathione lyase
MAKIIHSMIRVMDIERALEFYRDALQLKESHRLDFPDFTLVYLRDPESGFEIELTHNKGRVEPYTQGNAYGHIATCVDDLEKEHARLKKSGCAVGDIKELNREGATLARFFFLTDPDGYKIEVLQRRGHYQ